MYLGIDIGSSSSKAVVLDRNAALLGCAVLNLGTGSRGPQQALSAALEQAGITRAQLRKTVATGYGRLTFEGADKQITEISCHAKGVHHELPEVRTVIDIGGQDAKVICLDTRGSVSNFVMNDKCAAGTGRFLEVMARVLDCPLSELSSLAAGGRAGVSISNTCAVFAESEVISQLAAGKALADVALGAHESIARRIGGLAHRVGLVPQIAFTGGVALNDSVAECVSREFGQAVLRPRNPQAMGALGAALFAIDLDKER